jgi:hypothetical protein
MAPDFLSEFRDALLDFLSPLGEIADDAVAREAWLGQLGHTAAISGAPELVTIFEQAGAIKTELSALDLSNVDSIAGIQNLLQTARSVSTLVQALRQFGSDPSRASIAASFAEDVLALLLGSYLRRSHITLFRTASILTLIQPAETTPQAPAVIQNGVTVRYSPYYDQFNFSAVSALISNPDQTLRQYYFPNNLAQAQDAWTAAGRTFGNLGYFANAIGLSWSTQYTSLIPDPAPVDTSGSGSDDSSGDDSADGPVTIDEGRVGEDGDATDDQDVEATDPQESDDGDTTPIDSTPLPDTYFASAFPTLRLVILSSASNPGDQIAIELQCSSSSHPGNTPGYIVSLAGTFNSVTSFDSWQLTLSASGQIPAFVLKPAGFGLVSTAVPVSGGAAQIKLEKLAAAGSTGPAFILGSPTGTRIEIGTLTIEGDFSYDPSNIAAAVSAKVAQCSFVLKPSDGDSFLSSVLPSDGLTTQFDLGLTFSSNGGLSIQGGVGLDVTLPIGLSIAGVITIPSVHLALQAGASGLQAEVSASAGLSIGPIQASIDRIGVLGVVTFPEGGGNFGPIDLGANFKPPSGVGLAIDAAGVSGGGSLSFSAGQYSGILQLKFNDLALQAFGLITTQVAGNNGYSLIALIDADFPPVQLGWGFTLDGVGGLLAVHRTASVDNLRAAVKSGKVASFLFPTSPISNASQILGALNTLFPIAPGRFLFGPMALIGWGTPTVLTASVAVILELPEPIEIILLAKITATLPNPSSALVKLNMDALGVLDLTQDELSLDASLFDSKLISFVISGDMALRSNWSSSQREFLLAIGGFHPQFTPPSNFPTLNRVTIDMPSGIVSKLRLAAYLALTSNSVQFGATLDVFIGVSGCGISGHLGFDALLQLDPFHFAADISGSVAITVGGDDLASVSLDATLSGPAPWNIAGSFKIHIIFFDVSVSFSQSWGLNAPSQQTSTVDVGALLNAALADPRSWSSQLPAGLSALVSTRQIDDPSSVFAYPLALLEVHEQIVPLDLTITRFGEAVPWGATEFSVSDFRVGTQSTAYTAVRDDFAPAQFFDLSDSDKLSRPSYESHDAGAIMSGNLVTNGTSVAKTIDYESFFINSPGVVTVDEGVPQPFPWTALPIVMRYGAAARKAISQAGKLRYAAPGNPIKVSDPAFTLAGTATLAAVTTPAAAGTTYSDAAAALNKASAASPSQRDMLQIVGSHELIEVA